MLRNDEERKNIYIYDSRDCPLVVVVLTGTCEITYISGHSLVYNIYKKCCYTSDNIRQ